jgi:hypothetical protein
MKNNIYFLITAAFILAGCQKLDREIITDLNQSQLKASYENVSRLLNGVYSEMQDGFQPIDGAMMASATDEAEFVNDNSAVQNFNNGSWNASNNPGGGAWISDFKGIRKANNFLVSADSINLDRYKLDPNAPSQSVYTTRLAEITRWKYEARFLRAFFYFDLVKKYGGVPIMKTAMSAEDIPSIKRNSLGECIQFISDECDSAAANLPVDYAATNSSDLGRATKGAALALKSRLLLYAASDLFNTPSWAGGFTDPLLISLPAGDREARWKAAADAAKAVIDLPGSGYEQFYDYPTLFRSYDAREIIFCRRNDYSNAFELANFPVGFDRGQSGNLPSQNLVDAYDIKLSANISIPFDWNNPLHAANPYATSGPTKRDPRLFNTIAVNNSYFSTVPGVSRPLEIYTGGRDGKPLINATKTGYYLRKYVNESINISQGQSAIHSWIYFRLAEIHLNYAEALNEYNPGDPDIKKYYDKVRGRYQVEMPGLPGRLSQSDVRTKIRNERRIELAFEDHRAWDVRRWMIAPAVLGVQLRGVDIARNAGNSFTYTPSVVEPRSFEVKMYLYPIPQGELNISNNLVQNPLW